MTLKRTLTIGSDLAEQRVDLALSRLLPELSRRELQRLCESGQIRRRGRPLRKSDLVLAGDSVDIEYGPCIAAADPAAVLLVRFESRHWVVVAKPALQPTVPRSGTELGTLANALVAAYPEMAGLGHRALEPGLLHRLDNGTSGLLVAARTSEGFRAATSALKQGQWEKHYLALVEGRDLPRTGVIEGCLVANRRQPHRVLVPDGVRIAAAIAEHHRATALDVTDRDQRKPARPAATRFTVLSRLERITCVEIVVGTAFRHQIRAHFAAAGWPLVNDEIYGAVANQHLAPRRHALHAARVAWSGTAGLEGFDVTEPLAEDLAALLRVPGAGIP